MVEPNSTALSPTIDKTEEDKIILPEEEVDKSYTIIEKIEYLKSNSNF
jgi:hypothetical protein